LRNAGIQQISIHDPHVRTEELPSVERVLFETLRDKDCACLLTAHREYRTLDPAQVRKVMRRPIFIDGRNVLPQSASSELQVIRLGVGRVIRAQGS